MDFRFTVEEEAFREAQPDLKPLDIPSFLPAGMIAQMEGDQPTAHALMVGRVLEAIEAAGPLDGLFLYLHGAMVSEAYPDADGELWTSTNLSNAAMIALLQGRGYRAMGQIDGLDAGDPEVIFRRSAG